MSTTHSHIAKLMLLATLGLAACSNTFYFMEKELDGPILYFGKDTTNRAASTKVFFKNLPEGQRFPFKFHITPDQVGSLAEITVTVEGGGGTLKAADNLVVLQAEGNHLKGAFPAQKNTRLELSFLPDTEKGEVIYKLIFAARSRHGIVSKINVSTLTIKTYQNLPPVAKLTVTPDASSSKFNYNFDVTGSFDQDKGYGGILKRYKYTVTGTSYLHVFLLEPSQKPYPYSFPNTGTFSVSLSVQDNNGEWSPPVEQKITIPQ